MKKMKKINIYFIKTQNELVSFRLFCFVGEIKQRFKTENVVSQVYTTPKKCKWYLYSIKGKERVV